MTNGGEGAFRRHIGSCAAADAERWLGYDSPSTLGEIREAMDDRRLPPPFPSVPPPQLSRTRADHTRFGKPRYIEVINELACMSTRNFQIAYFEQGDKIDAFAMELFERGLIGTDDTQGIEARFALEGKGELVRSIQGNL